MTQRLPFGVGGSAERPAKRQNFFGKSEKTLDFAPGMWYNTFALLPV